MADEKQMIKRVGNVQTAMIGDELGMMNLDTGKYFLLDAVGAAIWELTEPPAFVEDIITSLTQSFDVSREQCAHDVWAFVGTLQEKKLIEMM